MDQSVTKRFSDFAKDLPLEGEKKRIDDVLNTEILVTAYGLKQASLERRITRSA